MAVVRAGCDLPEKTLTPRILTLVDQYYPDLSRVLIVVCEMSCDKILISSNVPVVKLQGGSRSLETFGDRHVKELLFFRSPELINAPSGGNNLWHH